MNLIYVGYTVYCSSMQALWSYTKDEIFFDREFVPLIGHQRGRWQVDFSKLSLTTPTSRRGHDSDHTHPDSDTSDL